METLSTGMSSGGFNQFFEDTESNESINENEALINESIKKLCHNPS
jgi:hypothetical protein